MTVDYLIKQLEDYANGPSHDGDDDDDDSREAAQQIADELIALESIYGEKSIGLLPVSHQSISQHISIGATDDIEQTQALIWIPNSIIRICLSIPLSSIVSGSNNEHDAVAIIKLSASLPIGYPKCNSAPQMQLLNRYIGSYGVDHSIFGEITRLYYHREGSDNVIFTPGEVALYEGIEKAREKVENWYLEQESNVAKNRENDTAHQITTNINAESVEKNLSVQKENDAISEEIERAENITIFRSDPITERKSIFIGHAAILKDASQVPIILSQILADKKIARASHPTIYAWVCKSKGSNTIHRDCNDDGETAAGGRLAHLLDLLHLENVIVVVTRWYGGIQLGADRFKLINRAAREALEMVNLVSGPLNLSITSIATETKGNKK